MKKNKLDKIDRQIIIKHKLTIGCVLILVLAAIIVFSLYISEESFRSWVDVNILRKNVSNDDLITIDLESDKNNQIYCYDKYICILQDKSLNIYNSSGNNVSEIVVNINNAIFNSEDDFLVIAENEGQEFYVVSDKEFLWQNKVEGNILQIYVNKNGYVAVVSEDSAYKSIITMYDNSGKELFKNYLSSTLVEDLTISQDNKYIAFSEIDTSGVLIQSYVKIISVDKAINDSENAIIYTYTSDVSKLIINIKYLEKDNLVALYDDQIVNIKNERGEIIVDLTDNDSFATIKLKNSIAYIEEQATGIFDSQSVLNIKNINNNQGYVFNFSETTKNIYSCGDIIAINVGSEIYFVKTNGILTKKYSSNQEITNVMISNDIAIVICKDRIEIIDL